jgi:hypothetical protein
MTSFRFEIGAKGRQASRFIGRVRSQLLRAFVEESDNDAVTAQSLAKALTMRKSDLTRQLDGEDNLTLRAVAEIAGALGREIVFELRPTTTTVGQNFIAETSTVASAQVVSVGGSTRGSSTLPARRAQSTYGGRVETGRVETKSVV